MMNTDLVGPIVVVLLSVFGLIGLIALIAWMDVKAYVIVHSPEHGHCGDECWCRRRMQSAGIRCTNVRCSQCYEVSR